MMTFVQLRCFLAVVDEMNYRRAAERLNMTQPPLTRHIQALEHAVGAALFDRSARTIRLTPAGQRFVTAARRLLAQAGEAVLDVRRVAGGDSGSLTLAFTASAHYAVLPRVVALIRQALPEVALTLREMTSAQQIIGMRQGQIDMGLTRPSLAHPGIASMPIWSEPLLVALPSHHPLSTREALSIHDLDGENLVTYPPVEGVYFHGLITGVFRAMGVEWGQIQYISQTHSILALVGAGLGVALVPASVASVQFNDVTLRPLTGMDDVRAEMLLAWLTDSDNATIVRVLNVLTSAKQDAAWLR